MVSRDLPVGHARALAVVAPGVTFNLVGLHWQGRGRVLFRVRSSGGSWGAWQAADADSGPDDQSSEAKLSRAWHVGNAVWTGSSDRIEWRTTPAIRRLRAYFISSPAQVVPMRTLSIAGSPAITSRAGWKADEHIRRAPPRYAPALRMAVIHHTAGSNSYSPVQSAAIVRGIELYHVEANGWNDIGYNFLVDRYGQVFEGRYGGMTRNVVGAHSEGFNTGSVGIAVIGNFSSAALPRAAEDALVRLVAWRLDVAHVEPLSSLTWVSYGNARFHLGTPVVLRAVSGHRDTGFTECPGQGIYAKLGEIASRAERLGVPKLYAPSVVGKIGGPVRFQARLSKALPWTITVADSGETVARGTGTGTAISWIWNSAGVARGRYVWTMEAGPAVRPASGNVGGGQVTPPPPSAALVRNLTVSPSVLSPNADGYADSGRISYTLGATASVTVEISDETGAVLAAPVEGELQVAGRTALDYAPDPLPDGRFLVTVTGRTPTGRTGVARARFTVDRLLSLVSVQPTVFSPNDDGIDDTVSISFTVIRTALVIIEIQQAGGLVTLAFEDTLGPGSYSVPWDGQTPLGPAAPGQYDVVVRAADSFGEVAQSATFYLAPG
jgi:hypothetical protein